MMILNLICLEIGLPTSLFVDDSPYEGNCFLLNNNKRSIKKEGQFLKTP